MKKKYFSGLYIILIIAFLSACAGAVRTPSTTDSRTDNTTGKAEDLNKYRPKFGQPGTANAAGTNTPAAATAMPTKHVNAKVAALMDTVATMNKSIRFAQGYRILAYTGIERKTALDLRASIVARLPDEPVYPEYKQPTWRVKVGDYFSRIEAQQMLLRIRDLAPNAMIVVDQINVK